MRKKLTGCPRDRSPRNLDPPPGICRAEPTTWHDLDDPEPSTSTSTTEPSRAALEPLSRAGGADRNATPWEQFGGSWGSWGRFPTLSPVRMVQGVVFPYETAPPAPDLP